MVLNQSRKIVSVMAVNTVSTTIGESHLRLGDDSSDFSTANQVVYSYIYDGGSF